MAKKTAPLIETKKLCKSYFDGELETKVLFDVDLTIERGEFIAIMGPSGSGKSTLMHILGFLDHLTKGSYLFEGEPTKELPEDELSRIRAMRVSFVFQAFNLLPRTSVKQNVLLPLVYHPTIKPEEREALADKAIEAVGLTDWAGNLSNQISGGQKQRVAIARALVTGPDIIFADEPTGNLDTQTGIDVMEIFRGLHEEGHTVILVTHEEEIAEYANRVIEIRDGKIHRDRKTKNHSSK